MSFFDPQNPGIGIANELTSQELLTIQQIAALGDPNNDRILFWDDSAGQIAYLAAGSGLSISGTTISATGGAGLGDVVGPASATDNAVVLYDGTTGKLVKDSTIKLVTTAFSPVTNDGVALGSTTLMWADLFLASGGVINFNNGNVTLTHSAGILTLGGTATLALGANSLTMTGSLAATGARVTKGWFTDVESTNMPTVGGTAILTSLTAPQFTTIELGAASDTTLSRVSAGLIAVEGKTVVDVSTAQTLTTKTLTTPVINGTITGTGQDTAATASTIVMRDASGNVNVNNLGEGFTTTATAAGTTTLTITATFTQVFTGSTTQTVKLPTTSVVVGQQYLIINQSSGLVTVQSSGANTIVILGASTSALFTAVVVTPTTAANWDFQYSSVKAASGKVGTFSNTITLAGTDATTMTFPTTSKTIAANDGSNWTFASQAIGDLVYASSTTAFARLAAVAVGQVLSSAGTGTAPAWSSAPQITTIELGAATDTTLARVSAGVVSIEGVNILTVAGGTLTGSITLGENTGIALDPAGSADGKWSGITITGVSDYTQAFGDLVYLKASNSRWAATDADASATAGPVMVAMVVSTGTSGNACTLLLQGQIRADAKFPALTIGAPVYVGETAGEIQVAIPTGADNIIRVVGFALTADEIYFNPSQDHQVTVA